MNYLKCRGIQLWGSGRERSELESSAKERNTAHEIPRLVDKGAKKTQWRTSWDLFICFNQRMMKSTCLLDSDQCEKHKPTWLRNSVLHQTQQTLPYKYLIAFTDLLKERRQRQHRSFFSIFILLLLFPVLFTDIRITKLYGVSTSGNSDGNL